MLKLVKYDFRRNRDLILAVFVITILAQIWIGFANFSDQELFSLNIVTYVIAAVILLIFALRTYAHNLKSYNRRLLPVQIHNTVLTPLLLFLALLLGVIIMAYIHLGVYIMMYSTSFLPVNFFPISSYALLLIIWSAAFSMLLVMISITVAQSVRVKGRVWIGLASFCVIQYVISFIEKRLFDHTFISLEDAFQFKVIDETARFNGMEIYFLGLLPTLFEAVIAVILVIVIIKLVKKRVES